MELKVKRKTTTQKTSPYFNKKKKESVTIKEEQVTATTLRVPDLLEYDLKVLFVGINPGLTSAARQHHYAGPTNHFWPSLSQSGLVDTKVTFLDDVTLPQRYQLGFTNLTARTTRRASDLTLAEQRAGIPILQEKIKKYRPRIACFVGKGIFEIYSGMKCNTMGIQSSEFDLPWDDHEGKTIVFVMPSTSGIVSAYSKADRVRFFQELCQVTNQQVDLFPIEETETSSVKQEPALDEPGSTITVCERRNIE